MAPRKPVSLTPLFIVRVGGVGWEGTASFDTCNPSWIFLLGDCTGLALLLLPLLHMDIWRVLLAVATVYLHQLPPLSLGRETLQRAASCQPRSWVSTEGGIKTLVFNGLSVLLKVVCRDPGSLHVPTHA